MVDEGQMKYVKRALGDRTTELYHRLNVIIRSGVGFVVEE